mgnify:CR=1 FL=1
MDQKQRTRRRLARRASESVLWRNAEEVTANEVLYNQAARIARRFVVSGSLARVIAEHAYQNGGRSHV